MASALRIPIVASLIPMVIKVTVPPCFSVKRSPSSTALAAAGSSSWVTPLRTMRLVLGSISIVTVVAGMTLPQTTIFTAQCSQKKIAGSDTTKAPSGSGRLVDMELYWAIRIAGKNLRQPLLDVALHDHVQNLLAIPDRLV